MSEPTSMEIDLLRLTKKWGVELRELREDIKDVKPKNRGEFQTGIDTLNNCREAVLDILEKYRGK